MLVAEGSRRDQEWFRARSLDFGWSCPDKLRVVDIKLRVVDIYIYIYIHTHIYIFIHIYIYV